MPREPHWLEQRYKDLFPKRLTESNGSRPHVEGVPADLDRYVAAALKGVIGDLRKATEGERNTQLNKSAYRLGRLIGGMRLDETLARSFLVDTARGIGLPDDETHKTIDSGILAGKREPFTPDGNDYVTAAAMVAEAFPPSVDWHVTLDPNRIDTTDWLIEGIVERGQLCVLYAPPKTHKSLIVQWLCAQLALQCTVLYIDFENTEKDLFRRFGQPGMQCEPEDLKRLIYLQFPPLPPLDTVVGGATLLRWVDQCKPALVVIDTTSRVVSGAENDSDTFRALYNRTLVYIKALGIGILRIDHSGKDAALGQRGSSAKNDDVDAVWQLVQQDESLFMLRCTHQRTGHHPDIIPLRKETAPLRFVRLTDTPVPMGPLSMDQLVMEMDRLGVSADIPQRDIHHFVLNLGLKATQRDTKRAQAYRVDRRNELALVLPEMPESQPESLIKSHDQRVAVSLPDHKITESSLFPALGPNHSTESLRFGLRPGEAVEAGSHTGGAISPPVIRPSDAPHLATVVSVLGNNVSIVECSSRDSSACTVSIGLIHIAGQAVCKPCAYKRAKGHRCCKGSGYTLRPSCMDCPLFATAVEP